MANIQYKAGSIKADIKGDADKYIKKLSADLQRKTIKKALQRAAAKVAQRAQWAAPVKTGKLRKSLKPVVVNNKRTGGQWAGYVAGAPHTHLIEAGWWHQPTKRQRAAFGSNWKTWIKGKRFLSEAFKTTEGEARKIILDTFRQAAKKIKV